ncbi:MAG: hypothetical protein J6V32_02925 [Elusimicrobiaceae bacterium]|nr:hypothetical protein [Elusimicrobiaceae bacterium]
MIKVFLKGEKGVTLLEGLIAIGLLAIVSVSTFSVIVSISRRGSQPDIREDMFLALERAQSELQKYVFPGTDSVYQQGLCNNSDTTPLAEGSHTINCLLPYKCNSGSFTYTVSNTDLEQFIGQVTYPAENRTISDENKSDYYGAKTITFNITCNGVTL